MARCWMLPLILLAAAAVVGQDARVDPERILAERIGFTSAEVAQARQGKPVTRVRTTGDELAVGGAIRLAGKKERLSDWVRNIEHFRNAAQLGSTRLVKTPPSAASFAEVTLDASDLADLKQCRNDKCAIRVSGEALARLQRDVAWDSPTAASQATDIVRQMMLGYTNAYLSGGNAAAAAYDGPQARRSFVEDMRTLTQHATRLTDLAPPLVAFLDGFPSATLSPAEQIFYWAAAPVGSNVILSVHHLTVYRPAPGTAWIADKSIYASRYIDAGVLAIGLYDAPDGQGFYAIAGSRIKASKLGSGVAATVLRRQIERSAADTVKMYLEWIRDSLAQGGN